MNINATLFGQALTFLVFVWFCMKFVWPLIRNIMDEREKRIADGLAAADKAEHDLERAQERAAQQLREAKQEAAGLIEQANKRAAQIVDEAKTQAESEGERLKAAAQAEIEQEVSRAREQLRQQVSGLAVRGAEKILKKEIDQQKHQALVEDLVKSL